MEIPLKGLSGGWTKLGNSVAEAGVQQKNFRHQSSRIKHLGRSNPTSYHHYWLLTIHKLQNHYQGSNMSMNCFIRLFFPKNKNIKKKKEIIMEKGQLKHLIIDLEYVLYLGHCLKTIFHVLYCSFADLLTDDTKMSNEQWHVIRTACKSISDVFTTNRHQQQTFS